MKNEEQRESFVMLTLTDYQRMMNVQKDLESRNSQVSENLMMFEHFLKAMNEDEGLIKMFDENLNKYEKIGTAIFTTYESVKEKLAINLNKTKK